MRIAAARSERHHEQRGLSRWHHRLELRTQIAPARGRALCSSWVHFRRHRSKGGGGGRLPAGSTPDGTTSGALVFTCNGRGSNLFPEPHHDARTIQEIWNSLPLAGFFAQGEIGPVAGKNFVHGFTASVVLFESM